MLDKLRPAIDVLLTGRYELQDIVAIHWSSLAGFGPTRITLSRTRGSPSSELPRRLEQTLVNQTLQCSLRQPQLERGLTILQPFEVQQPPDRPGPVVDCSDDGTRETGRLLSAEALIRTAVRVGAG